MDDKTRMVVSRALRAIREEHCPCDVEAEDCVICGEALAPLDELLEGG